MTEHSDLEDPSDFDHDSVEKVGLLGSSFAQNLGKSTLRRNRWLPKPWLQHRYARLFHRRLLLQSRPCLLLRLRTLFGLAFIAFILGSLLNGILRPSYSNPPQHYKELAERVRSSSQSGRGNLRNEKVFIAANIINEDLIRGSWSASLLSLVELLGQDNVFVSIYENDSGNGTSSALQDLRSQLSCNASVVTGDHLPMSLFPSVHLPSGEQTVQRITYLAEVRNRLLRPLDSTYGSNTSSGFTSTADTKFDRILFLNDIYFDPLDAAHLLFSTNADSGQAKYRAACAMDFIRGAQQYDTFVVRDTDGYSSGFMLYPWFAPVGSSTSRSAVLSQTDAVPVRSCWGGMAAFNASLFQTRDASSAFSMSADYELLHFRSSGELFWEAAECCLVFADIEEQYGMPNADDGTGVFVNPYVRVAYSQSTWFWLPILRRFERMFQYLQYILSKMVYPEFNPRRLHEPGELVDEMIWQPASPTVPESGGQFNVVHRQASPGGFCGQRRLFVMKHDLETANTDSTGINWEKITLPR